MTDSVNYAVSYLAEDASKEEQLAEAVRRMRNAQKAFFKSDIGTWERVNSLRDSRYWERVVDDMLEERRDEVSPQLALPI
jgi:hypothetical protein